MATPSIQITIGDQQFEIPEFGRYLLDLSGSIATGEASIEVDQIQTFLEAVTQLDPEFLRSGAIIYIKAEGGFYAWNRADYKLIELSFELCRCFFERQLRGVESEHLTAKEIRAIETQLEYIKFALDEIRQGGQTPVMNPEPETETEPETEPEIEPETEPEPETETGIEDLGAMPVMPGM